MNYRSPLVIVDVETTGMSPTRGRVIEIACIRIENGEEVDRFVSLVDPEQSLSLETRAITGITADMVRSAPTFVQIADRINEIFDGATLCAHNARFDYSFIKAEMERAGYTFKKTQLCTAKLSRSMFPEHRKHDLSSLIERYNFTCDARHRAEGDADVLVQFLKYIEKVSEEGVSSAFGKVTGSTCIPAQLDKSVIDNLPETPGVYTFYGEDGEILYIGKSINIKSRIMSHFSNTNRDGKEMRLWQEVYDIGYETTVSDLGASLLELAKIKSEYPKYNRMSRKVQSMWYLVKTINDAGYISFNLVPDSKIELGNFSNLYAVFKTKSQAMMFLREFAGEHKLCQKLLGVETGKGACFSSQIGKCSGACTGKISPEEYNAQIEGLFAERKMRIWPYKDKVMLKYSDKDNEKTEVFVVNNWMLEEALVYETDEPQQFLGTLSHLFDYDVYKVLVRHMKIAKNIY